MDPTTTAQLKAALVYSNRENEQLRAQVKQLEDQLGQLREAVDAYLNDCSCRHTLARVFASTEGEE